MEQAQRTGRISDHKLRYRLYGQKGKQMRYMRLSHYEQAIHPSIHYTGSVRGMKKLGYWHKNDECVRCGQYIYNLSQRIR